MNLPPIGLASTESAQINVLNLAAATTTGTAASCTGTVAFLGSSGATIGTATPFTVTGGQIFPVALPYAKIGATGGALTTTLETYDTVTGVTHAFLANGGGISFGGAGFGR